MFGTMRQIKWKTQWKHQLLRITSSCCESNTAKQWISYHLQHNLLQAHSHNYIPPLTYFSTCSAAVGVKTIWHVPIIWLSCDSHVTVVAIDLMKLTSLSHVTDSGRHSAAILSGQWSISTAEQLATSFLNSARRDFHPECTRSQQA